MIGTIIGLVVVAVAIFFILKILKSIIIFKFLFRIISLLFVAFIVILIVFSYFIIKDANDFKKNFANSKNLIILANKDSQNNNLDNNIYNIILASIVDNKTYMPINDIKNISDSYEKYEFSDINEKYYKIVYIRTESLDSFDKIKINELNVSLSGSELREILESDSPGKKLSKIITNNVTNNDGTIESKILSLEDSEIKHYLLTYVISEFFNPKNVNILLSNIKSKNIFIYEDTALFKSMRYIPQIFINDITQKNIL